MAGTVSVVDKTAGCFSRIWCVFELFKSLTGAEESYTYDLATAHPWVDRKDYLLNGAEPTEHGAVAIIDGTSAKQANAREKLRQEDAFPLDLIEYAAQAHTVAHVSHLPLRCLQQRC